ncbi:MAG: IS1380 family transposase, partial [Pseudonocardiaceae bacterium]
AYADHGAGGTGEPVAGLLRPGNAGSNTAADHIKVFDAALAQLPAHLREPDEHGARSVLVRTDAAGATHTFTHHLAAAGVQFSVGAYLHHFDIPHVLTQLPERAWTPAYQVRAPRAGEQGPVIEPREGAWVTEVTGLVDLSAWPAGTRLILRRERPHPGAQLRITDVDGHRIVGMLTNTPGEQLPDLELRHRRHARVEDRIRAAKDTGIRNLPYHDLAQNRVWLAITALAQDLLAWCQRLALTGPAASYEPKRLRLRILAVAGRLVRTARRTLLKIPQTWPWAHQITTAHARLATLTP